MDELPELPFEQVLSYLSLKDRLKARTISRAWRNTFDRYPVNTLCYSGRPSDFIWEKNRWVSGAFAENFISSTRFATFFDTFGQTILFSLKRLRLCGLQMSKGTRKAFTSILNSFSQLEQLDIIWAKCNKEREFNLNLPMLTSLLIENVDGIKKLILEAPRLRQIKILECSLKLEIVPGESVETLLVDRREYIEMKNLKNLKVLYIGDGSTEGIDSTFLSSLQQLKEIHTDDSESVSELFEQKQRSGCANLKIYLCGLLLNGPHDPAINTLNDTSSGSLSREWLVCLAENPTRRADVIPFCHHLRYWAIEGVPPGLEVVVLKRFTDLKEITVNHPVRDIERFLDLLKNCENISRLSFSCDQPQDLFDRLPEHSAVQKLILNSEPSDLDFLFRLKHLIHLHIGSSIDSETIRRALKEFPVLSYFFFYYDRKTALIQRDHPKRFTVSVYGREKKTIGLNAAIEFITGNENATSRSQQKRACGKRSSRVPARGSRGAASVQ